MPHRPAPLLFVLASIVAAGAATPPGPYPRLVSLGAQAGGPATATTVHALRQSPAFYNLKTVVVRGTMVVTNGTAWLRTDEPSQVVCVVGWRGGWPEGLVEVRGQVLDVGRLGKDDPRLAGFDMESLVERVADGRWPGAGEMPVIRASSVVPAEVLPATSLRAVVLEPAKYEGSRVTLTGQFAGRNLYGDLPQALGRDRWDFVVRAEAAAIWVSGLRPRGKDFDLDPGRRVDTGTWLTVTGTVRRHNAIPWVEAAGLQKAPRPDEPVQGPAAPPPGPPPEVRFSVPTEGETDVRVTTTVRIQFTRDLDGTTIAGRTRVSYVAGAGEAPTPALAHSAGWDAGNRAVTITLAAPLERFRTVRVELLEGILGVDGQPLAPWTLTFTTS